MAIERQITRDELTVTIAQIILDMTYEDIPLMKCDDIVSRLWTNGPIIQQLRETVRERLCSTVKILNTPGTPFYDAHNPEHLYMTVTEEFFKNSKKQDRHKFNQLQIEASIPGRGPSKTQGIALALDNDPVYLLWVQDRANSGSAKLRINEQRILQATATGVLTSSDAHAIASKIGRKVLLPSPPAGLLL